jgi:hypothetical protein
MRKRTSRSVCALNVVVRLHPLSPTLSISSDIQTPWNIEKDPDDPEPAEEGDIQMEYSWLVVEPKYRSSNKKWYADT